MSGKPQRLEKAEQAFGPLPPEVVALGIPLSVHPPSGLAKFGSFQQQLARQLSDPVAERKRAAVMMVVMPVVGLVFLVMYLLGVKIGDAPQLLWLVFALVGFVFGALSAAHWFYLSKKTANAPAATPPATSGGALPGVIMYNAAMVHVRGREFTDIRWIDVQTIDAPAVASNWRITARDGRQITLPAWIEDDGTAIQNMVDRVKAVLIPQFLQQIEAGQNVMFGPFGVSKYFVYYKDKKATWDEITSMRILTGSMYNLQIFCGGMVPWCNFDLLKAPNGQMVYDLLTRVAPPRLLKPAN